MTAVSYEDQGSGYDPGARGYELQGRASKPPAFCKCGVRLGRAGKCPALCEPIPDKPPAYEGPSLIGSTHIGRLARPVR